MVFIETPASRAAWKTATGAAETRAGSIAHTVHPILAIPIRQKGDAAASQHATDRPESAIPARAPGTPKTGELLVVAIMHSCAVSQGGCDLQADFMRLADRCFGPCGTAARMLRGTPVGDTPICVSFRMRGGKGRQWTERPG